MPLFAGFVTKWYLAFGAVESDATILLGVLILSSVLNAAYFLPIIFMMWFDKEVSDGPDHGEAPVAAVAALTMTAFLTLAFFLFNGPVIDLERQLAANPTIWAHRLHLTVIVHSVTRLISIQHRCRQ